MNDKRWIKSQIIDLIAAGLDGQNDKGLKKYGQTLEECPPNKYDWDQMTIEELLDALQYQIKENRRLASKIREYERRLATYADNAKFAESTDIDKT